MLLADNERNAARSETPQGLAPSVLRRGVHDIVGLRHVKIVTLDPRPGSRLQPARVGRDDVAGRG